MWTEMYLLHWMLVHSFVPLTQGAAQVAKRAPCRAALGSEFGPVQLGFCLSDNAEDAVEPRKESEKGQRQAWKHAQEAP